MPSPIYLYILYPLIYIFPAYAANGAPVLAGRYIRRRKPLDLGMKLGGKRVFGDSKSIQGLIAGIAAGVAVGLIEYPFFHYMLPISVLLALGANAGDLLGSFVKRRLGYRGGSSFPVMDQYGFFVLALAFAFPMGHMPDLYGIAFLAALTGIAHVLTNRGANRLRLKKVPW